MAEKYKNQFARPNQAENYLKFRPSYNIEFLRSSIKHLIDEEKQKSETVNALDLACGSGQLTFKILPWFDKITGVDFSTKQLENAKLAIEKSDQANKLNLLEYDCSKIDEILNLPQIKELNPSFVFFAQSFHWFNYDDLLSKFVNQTKNKNVHLIIVSYRTLTVMAESENIRLLFSEFYKTIKNFFECDRPSLDNSYKEYDFTKHFSSVKFAEFEDEILDQDIRDFFGYLDTFSGYRNYMEFVKNDPSKDPLIIFMEKLGLKSNENRNFKAIEIPEECPKTISFKNNYFMYILSN